MRFIKEQLIKLQEFYQKSSSSSSTPTIYASNATAYHNGSPMMSDEQKLALRQFNYCQQLCKAMFEVSDRSRHVINSVQNWVFILFYLPFLLLGGST